MKLLRHWVLFGQIGIFLLGLCGSVYVSLTPANSMMNWYSIDDAFYYYKVAQNVLTGHGFTFDQINLTNGFHPLWMGVCLGVFWLSRFNLLLPLRVLILVSGIFNGLTGVLLFRLLRRALHPSAAVIGACVWMLLPAIFSTTTLHGMEASISAFFLILFLIQGVKFLVPGIDNSPKIPRLLLAGLIGALAILSRLDNLFVVAAVGFFMILRIRRINRILVFDMVPIIVAALTAWIIRFGTPTTALNAYSIYPMLLAGMVIKPLVLYFLGFYSSSIKERLGKFILRLGIAAVIIFGAEYGFLWSLRQLGFNLMLSRAVTGLDVLVSLVLIAAIRFVFMPRYKQAHHSAWEGLVTWVRGNLKRVLLEGIIFSIPIAFLMGAYMGINWFTFGTFTPVSGQIKLWWGSLSNTVYTHKTTLVEIVGLSPNSGYGPWSLLTSLVGDVSIFIRNLFGRDGEQIPSLLFLALCFAVFIILVYLLSRKDGYLARKSFTLLIPAFIIGCFLQITYYTARGYAHTRGWYWVAEMLTLVLLGAVLSSRFFEKMKLWTKSELANKVITFLFVVALLALHTRFITRMSPQRVTTENAAAYLEPISKLEARTNEGSLIGMTGGGNIAYFIKNRTIINLDGLINSMAYFRSLREGTTNEFLDKMKLDYVYGKPYILLETEPYNSIFRNHLDEIGYIRGPDSFTLYQYLRDH